MLIENLLVIIGVMIIAFIFAPIGLGGGMLFVPLLHYVSGWPIDGKLLAVSLLLTGVVSWGSGLTHRKEELVDDDIIGISLWGAVPGAVLGVLIIQLVEGDLDLIFKSLSLILISLALAKYTFITKIPDNKEFEQSQENVPGIVLGSGFGGFLSSVLAIGAGAIYVPTLQTFGKLKTRVSIGSSLNIMMIVVPIAVLSHLMVLSELQRNNLFEQVLFILTLLIITFFGSSFGAKFGIKNISEGRIMQIFIVILIIIWFRYLIDIFV
ncbi:MAG: sulfite exporter TauE/SafE family protein [Candidatus Poseidoniaceae archaeon]|nr:sulfite exporter TauE/SafE family protein [Candidatus Poseidoniaceae archaeon]